MHSWNLSKTLKLLSNNYAFDLCILANLAFDGPNLAFLHRHNGFTILIFRESWTPCRARTPHVAVVSRETTPPHARLFSFPHAPPPFLAGTKQMPPAWIKQRPLLATSKPSLRKPWDLDAVVHLGTVASIGSRRHGPSGDVDLRDEHGRATRERIGSDERRNCARTRKRPRYARENFPRRWKIPG